MDQAVPIAIGMFLFGFRCSLSRLLRDRILVLLITSEQ